MSSCRLRTEKKINQTIAFELEPQIPFPIEDAVLDYIVTPREGVGEVFAVILEKDGIAERIRVLEPFFKKVDIIDIDSFPVLSGILDRKGYKGCGMLLDMGHGMIKGIFFSAGRVVQVRSFGHTTQTTETGTGQLAAIISEIKNTMAYLKWNGELDADLSEIFVTGGGALDTQVRQDLGDGLGLPITPVDMAGLAEIKMDESVRSTWQPLIMNQALALAIRPHIKKIAGFNFRPFVLQDQKIKYIGILKNMRWVAVAVAICFLAGLADYYLDYALARARVLRLKSEITAIFKKSAPDIPVIVDPVQQLNGKIVESRKISRSLREMYANNSVLGILRDISTLAPVSTQFAIQSLTYDNNRIVLKGDSDNYDTVVSIKNELTRSPYFSAVTISSSSTAKQGSKVEFEMHLTVKALL